MGELPFAVVLIGFLLVLLLWEWLLGEIFVTPGRLIFGQFIKPEHLHPAIRGNHTIESFIKFLLAVIFWAVVWGAAYVAYHAYRQLA